MPLSLLITIILILIIVGAMIIIKFNLINSEALKMFNINKNDKNNQEKLSKTEINYIKNDDTIKNDNILEKMQNTVKTQKLINDLLKDDAVTSIDKIFYQPYTLIFTYDYELLSVSENFLELKDVSSFEELKRKYKIIKVLRDNNNNNDVNMLLSVLNESDKKYKITFNDIFDVSQKELNEIDDAINNNSNNNEINDDIVYHSKITLNVDSSDIQVKVMIDIKNDKKDKKFKVIFRVYKFIPKVSKLMDSFSGSRYEDLIKDVIINLSFPLFIINKEGVRFLNKCACDWFEIPYHRIDNIGNGIQLMHDIFDKIDPTIIDKFMQSLNSDNQTTVYVETLYDVNGSNTIMSDNGIKFIPKEIIVQGREFNVKGIDNLFVTITEATSLHSYIVNHKDFINDNNIDIHNECNLNKNSKKDNEEESNNVINYLTQINNNFKELFINSGSISFARIDINTRNIIISNKLFENNLQTELKGARYLLLINYIIELYKFDNRINYYSYDVIYKDLSINIKYCYGKDFVDVFIFDKINNRELISDKNINLLNNLQNTSDLSIITVDKTGNILIMNDNFKNHFLKQNNENVNLLDLIPESDKNKMKRSLSDSIKFNSCNLNDIITLVDENNNNIKINCIKTYMQINNKDLITITLLPINLELKRGE